MQNEELGEIRCPQSQALDLPALNSQEPRRTIMSDHRKPRRIALTIHALHGGGAERLLSDLANRWAATHEIHVATWSNVNTDAYPLAAGIERYGLGLVHQSTNIFQGMRANVRRVRTLRDTLRKIKPDFILSFSDQMNIVALQAARMIQAPVWISEHSDPRKQQLGFLWESWRRKVYPTCTGCVVLTSDIAAHLSRLIPAARLRVIPPAIHPKAVVENRPVKVAHAPCTILFVGRLSQEKRVDLLIAAWQQIAPALPNWQLRLVGDGEQRPRLEAQAAGLASIKFCGWSHDPQSHYRSADMFVLASQYEGFPVALLEAMDAGLPCISTSCSSAIGELNTPDESIVTVPVDGEPELASAILALARDPARRELLGERGRNIARRFHWDVIGPRWDTILEDAKE